MIPGTSRKESAMASIWRRFLGTVLVCLVAVPSLPAQNVSDGVYTEPQATRGQALYKGRCTSCHGDNLAGSTGPPLTGADFLANWDSQPLLELANKIRKTMPRDDSPRLTPQETADVLAYVLQV